MRARLRGLAVAVGAGVVLGLALWMDPAPAGVGTHTQLGLAGCAVLARFGVPCPMCGMTTSFAHMAEGDLGRALRAQPAGAGLFLALVAGAALGLADLLGARCLERLLAWAHRHEAGLAGFGLLLLGAAWAFKILTWSA